MGASPFLFHMGVELGGRRARQAPLMVTVAPVFMPPVTAIALQTPAPGDASHAKGACLRPAQT